MKNGYDLIAQIENLARAPEKYRSIWFERASRIAETVEAKIANLRVFASRQEGFVADRCNATANDLESKLQAVLAKFD